MAFHEFLKALIKAFTMIVAEARAEAGIKIAAVDRIECVTLIVVMTEVVAEAGRESMKTLIEAVTMALQEFLEAMIEAGTLIVAEASLKAGSIIEAVAGIEAVTLIEAEARVEAKSMIVAVAKMLVLNR